MKDRRPAKKNYILMYRSLMEHWLWPSGKSYTEAEAWIWLLMKAAHSPYTHSSDGKLHLVGIGELITSISKLSKVWNWSRKRVKGFLDRLTEERMIDSSECTRYDSRLKLINYAGFQGKNQIIGTDEYSTDGADDDSAKEQVPWRESAQAEAKSTLIKKNKELKNKNYTVADFETAEWILTKLREMNPKHKSPNLEAWANTIRLMREKDGRLDSEVRQLFEWANNDSFWRTNILSPDKLRVQWDSLLIKMNNQRKISNSAYGGGVVI